MAKLIFKFLFSLILIFICYPGFSTGNKPISIDSVDFFRIQHKQVRKFILQQKQYGVSTFDDMQPVCYNPIDSGSFMTFEKSMLIRQDIDLVWNNLIHQSPSDEFDGHITTFCLLYSRMLNNFLYHNESYNGIAEGQILFFNLRVLSGIKNIPVAMEVTRLDKDRKEIEYCYIDHGNTQGTQMVILKPTPEGFTEIIHFSKYKCKSQIRGRRLYSFFHDRVVQEFFTAIKIKSEGGKVSIEAER